MKFKLLLCFTIFYLFTHILSAQTYNSFVGIEAHYAMDPLDFVIEDLSKKYNLQFNYDKEELSKYKFTYLFDGTSLKMLCEILIRDKPLTYLIDDTGVIHITNKAVKLKSKKHKIVNSKYLGKAEGFDITISGVVKDMNTGEALPFASVKVKDKSIGTSTNIDGYFTLFKVPSDIATLQVGYVGYTNQEFYLSPKVAMEFITIEMEPSAQQLDVVEIKGEKEQLMEASDGISRVKITPRMIADLPSLGEKDIFRSFQLLPGISGSNESSAGLYVRGGTPDQNLILYDGFTVYHQEHLFGMYSAFNSNAIKDVQLYKGGFESKFGGRLSSVMEITGKTGNENDFNLGADLSLLSFNAFTEIPLNGKGSIFIAGRKSYRSPLYQKFFDAFNEENNEPPQQGPGGRGGGRFSQATEPVSFFYDLNAKVTYKPTKKDILSLSFFNGEDDLDNSRVINRSRGPFTVSGGTSDLTKWGNWGTSLKWSHNWNNKLYTNQLVSFSNYYSIRDRSTSINITREGETIERNLGTVEDNDLNDFTYKIDNEFKTGAHNQLEFGLQATHYDIDYSFIQNDSVSVLDIQEEANLLSFYLQDRWTPGKKLTLLPGIRVSQYSLTDKTYFEPRLQFTYDLTKKIKLKAAYGKYYQFTNRVIREDILTGSRDFWVLSDDETVPIGEAVHYIAGVSYENQGFLFDVETYYKDLTGLSEYTLRFSGQGGRGGQPELDYDSYFYEGTGYARGLEVLAQKKFGDYTGWIGYTFGEVRYNFPIYGDGYFAAAHDVTHELKIVNTYKWKRWTFSGTWIYATGKPYTQPLGTYTTTLLDGSTTENITVGPKNASRYPNYHRLDLSAKYTFDMKDLGIGSFSFSLFNVYNRNNTWYKEFEIDETGLTETDVNLLGITPNITFSFQLR